jgi:hypothetical protein
MVFKLHPQSEERKRSAVTLIKYLLAERSQTYCLRITENY